MTIFLICLALWLFSGYLAVLVINASEQKKTYGKPEQVDTWKQIFGHIAFGPFVFFLALCFAASEAIDRWKINRRRKKLPLGPTGIGATLFNIKRPPVPVEKEEAPYIDPDALYISNGTYTKYDPRTGY